LSSATENGNSVVLNLVTLSLDRARVYRGLADLFRTPSPESTRRARCCDIPELCEALDRLTENSNTALSSDLVHEARALRTLFDECDAERLRKAHHSAFDESRGSRSAPTEMDQLGGAPQLELTRTFEMADVAGFYKAFGVVVDEGSEGGERVDHITAELEFMNLLAVKESLALQEKGEGTHAKTCRDASRAFLRDHLGRWAPRLGNCMGQTSDDPIFRVAGRLLRDFVAFDSDTIKAHDVPPHRIADSRL
jgi:TorA maturation chaperone TorD